MNRIEGDLEVSGNLVLNGNIIKNEPIFPWPSFEHKYGWNKITNTALDKLQQLNVPGLKVVQVKEKFGHLRIYTNIAGRDINDIVSEAENNACITCEICGCQDGTVNLRHSEFNFLNTYCVKCAVEQKLEKNLELEEPLPF
jgi:hypothetical protein